MMVTFSKLLLYGIIIIIIMAMRYDKFEPIYRPQMTAIEVQWMYINFNKAICPAITIR